MAADRDADKNLPPAAHAGGAHGSSHAAMAPGTPGAGQRETPGAPPRRRRRWLLLLVAVALLAGGGFALYTWAALAYSYSSGERAGYVQKFSKKGWVCKTWEGELAMVNLPGAMPELFRFTVREDAVAARINQSMGQRVALHYEQHRGVPSSCFGDTEYFVTDVRPVRP